MELLKKIGDGVNAVFAITIFSFLAFCMVAVPVRNFFQSENLKKDLTPEQAQDYGSLLESEDQQSLTLAAHQLFQRPDLAGVSIWKGSHQEPDFQITLKKEVQAGFHLSYAPARYGEYSVQLNYFLPDKPLDIWAEFLMPMHGMGSAMGGLVLMGAIIFQLYALLEKRKKKEPDQPKGEIRPPEPAKVAEQTTQVSQPKFPTLRVIHGGTPMDIIFFVDIGSGEVAAKLIRYAGDDEKITWFEGGLTKAQVSNLRGNVRATCGEISLRLAQRSDPEKPFGEGNLIELQNLDAFSSFHAA
jgi:hypothetical protein